MVEHSKMSVKELKAFVKMYKKVHKTPFSKMKKPELVALAERVSKGEVHKKEAAAAPEAAPKAARASTEKQAAHRALFGAWVKAKTGKPFSEFKAGQGASPAAPAAAPKKFQLKKKIESAPVPAAVKKAPKEKKVKDLGAPTPVMPTMKVVGMEKKATDGLLAALEPEKPKKFQFKKKEAKNS